jgi:hypothetical protein
MELNSNEIEVIHTAILGREISLQKLAKGYTHLLNDMEDEQLVTFTNNKIEGIAKEIQIGRGVLEKLENEVI